MTEPLNSEEIEALGRIDTPTICNLIEMVAPERRGYGFTTRHLHCIFPELAPMVGYARTVTVRAKQAGPLDAEASLLKRFDYVDYVAQGPAPRISVVQDLDDEPGCGAFWGEVNSASHKALGCLGTVTNGSVRDLDMIAPGFQLLAGVVGPSHAFVHVADFGVQVNVHGMVVESGDLIHADRHGAVVIPDGVARDVAPALDLMQRREAVVIEAARDPEFTTDKLKDAYRRGASIKS